MEDIKMRYVKTVDYENLWYLLEQKIYDLAVEHDWSYAVSDDAYEQEEHYHKKEMCNKILELMEELQRKENI